MVAWQSYRFLQQELVAPSHVYDVEGTTDPRAIAQWPYLVASTIFLMEFMTCFLLILLLRLMLHFKDPGSGEVLFLGRLREVAEMLAFISFFSGVYYTYKACHSAAQPRHMGAGSFFAGQKEYRQGAHMLLWTMLAPQQWVMHARLYTKSSHLESAQLLLSTAFVMVFGMAAVQTDMSREGGRIGPHWEVRFWFTLSFLCLLATLKRAYQLPMQPVTAKAGMFYLKVKFFFWLGYPAIYVLRSFNIVSAWQEEVLLLTFLDLITKCLSLIASCTGPLFTLFVSTWGHWHVSGGSHDIRVRVRDPSWAVESVEMDSSPDEGEQITGLTAGSSDFLQEAVGTIEERRRLVQIAKQVDAQLSFMAHKTPLTVVLAGGIRSKAECYVSRSLWGHRQLAISLVEYGAGADDTLREQSKALIDGSSHDDTRSPLESPRSQGSMDESNRTSEFTAGGRFNVSQASQLHLQQGVAEAPQRLTPAKVALHQHWNDVRRRLGKSSGKCGLASSSPYWATSGPVLNNVLIAEAGEIP